MINDHIDYFSVVLNQLNVFGISLNLRVVDWNLPKLIKGAFGASALIAFDKQK